MDAAVPPRGGPAAPVGVRSVLANGDDVEEEHRDRTVGHRHMQQHLGEIRCPAMDYSSSPVSTGVFGHRPDYLGHGHHIVNADTLVKEELAPRLKA